MHLRRISKVVKNWPGDPLDEWGSLRVLNVNGTKPPLFWCFNGAIEFPALADALGPDQPVVGMRSLNQVLDPAAITTTHTRQLGEYYGRKLFERFGAAACIIGANCQAAPISYAMALGLKSRQTEILYLVTLDAELHRAYQGQIRMLFGQNSRDRNPFYGKEIDLDAVPALNWRYAISVVNCEIISGGHGEYFLPGNVSNLARAISAPSVKTKTGKVMSRLPQWQVVEEDEGYITVSTPKTACETSEFAILPVWEKDAEMQPQIGDEWMAFPSVVKSKFVCKLKKPEGDGEWLLRLVICQQDVGPCRWPLTKFQTIPLIIGQSSQDRSSVIHKRLNFNCRLRIAVRKFILKLQDWKMR
jgi:hypothetical protein